MNENINNEIQEIQSLIETILSKVDTALKYFKFAEKLGIFDVFIGGFLTSIFKRQKIRKGNNICIEMQENIKLLNNKILDINFEDNFIFENDTPFDLMDIFWDNPIIDMIVQDKITNIVNRLEVFKHRIETLDRNIKNKMSLQ